MLTRFVRIQLTIFTVATIIGVFVMIDSYLQVPTLLGIGRITVTLELPASGGLYRFSNVTYRGVQVGKITAVEPTRNGAKATLSLGTSPQIPANLLAEVRSISAVGEQYVDLRPRTDSAPYLRDGSVIPIGQTTIPQAVGPMLDQASALINSIPKDKLGALVDESFTGLNGSGYDLGSLFDSSARVAADFNGVAERTRTLTEDTAPLLDSQAQTVDSIRLWARSLAGVTEQVANDDTQVRTLLQTGPGAADEAARLLDQIKLTVPVLLANLTTLGQIGVTYHPGLEQLLVLLPPAIAGLQSAQPTNNYTGLPMGGSHITIGDPPACTVGFLPPDQWRSPADTTTVDTPDGLYCKLPQDSPIAVRGARNYPCMGHPGKRAPTVEICNSDKPFEPLAMRQHFAGPYPLDPNLLSQRVPPDQRIKVDERTFGPVEGTPRLPPPQLAPAPSLGPLQPQSGFALPPLDNLAGPPRLGSPTNAVSPPPLGSLAPMDTPDSVVPAPVAPPAPTDTAPPPAGTPSVAPSSFATNGSGKGPPIAIAKYNADTGVYVGPDGKLYRQSDLVRSSDHHAKTWKDLILTDT
ncbi:MCE family protein [Mycobacterium sp. Dal123C01]|uniref:MCE family protein n=1 Tax=Mycobacterium sp. Dal123C01 TaxID=3457577 RepID=UPI00403EDF11